MSCEYPFKFAERCLYEYQGNVARLASLRCKLAELDASTSAHVQSFEAGHNAGPGDPVGVRFLKLESLEEEIARLTWRVESITKLLSVLEAPFVWDNTPMANIGKFIRLWYFCKVPKNDIIATLGISKPSAFRLRRKVVELVIKYLGI